MADSYPYVISNNRLPEIFEKIKSAAKPPKFTNEFLKKLGFASSNDRAVIPLLRRLGFLSEDGSPTVNYDRLKDSTEMPYVLSERIRDLYDELYGVNTEIHKSSDTEIKGAFARITGKDEDTVKRYFSTFRALAAMAKFDKHVTKQIEETEEPPIDIPEKTVKITGSKNPEFFYNIQIHLPATTDISVYNAIFKSLRDHILD